MNAHVQTSGDVHQLIIHTQVQMFGKSIISNEFPRGVYESSGKSRAFRSVSL